MAREATPLEDDGATRFFRSALANTRRYSAPLTDPSTTNLCLNEHPAPPSPRIASALAGVDARKLTTYDVETVRALRTKLAAREGVRPENIVLFGGESQALQTLFGALGSSRVAFPSIGWGYYETLARLQALTVSTYDVVRNDSTFSVDPSSISEALGDECALVLFINPHMPTGHATASAVIFDVARAHPQTLVLVDEAYDGFSPEVASVASAVEHYENLVVAKTFSKYFGLASLRVGYLVASEAVAAELEKAATPFAIPYLSSVLACAALDDEDYYRRAAREIMATKEAFVARLSALRGPGGPRAYVSHANFLLVEFAGGADEAKAVEARLLDAGIVVRSAGSYGLPSFLRISVGTADVMDRVARVIERHYMPADHASGVRLVDDERRAPSAEVDYRFIVAMSPNYARMGKAFLHALNHFEKGRSVTILTLEKDLGWMREWAKAFKDVTVLPFDNREGFSFGDWHPLIWAKLEAFAMTDSPFNVVLDVDQILYRSVREDVLRARDAGKTLSASPDITSLHGHMHASRLTEPLLAGLPEGGCLNAGAMIVRPSRAAAAEIAQLAKAYHRHMWLPEQGILNVWSHLSGESHDLGDQFMLEPWSPKVLSREAATLIHFWTPRPAFFGDSPLRKNEPLWNECLARFEATTGTRYPLERFERDFAMRLSNFGRDSLELRPPMGIAA